MVRYFCDKCQKQITSISDRSIVRITKGDSKQITKHYCNSCFKEFKELFDNFNGTESEVFEIASQGRTQAFLIMKLMIMLYRHMFNQAEISKYLEIPMSTLVAYKKKYFSKAAEIRVLACDDYTRDDKFIHYDVFLTILSAKGKTSEDAQLEFDPSKKDISVKLVRALMCFFTNIINLDWFHSADEVVSVLRKYRADMAEEFQNQNR